MKLRLRIFLVPIIVIGIVFSAYVTSDAQAVPGSAPGAMSTPAPGSTPAAGPTTIKPGSIVSFFTMATVAQNAQNTAIAIFQALFGIEILYAGGMWALQAKNSQRLFVDYATKIIQGMTMLLIIKNAPTALTFTVNAARCLALNTTVSSSSWTGSCATGSSLMGGSITTAPPTGTSFAAGTTSSLPPDLTNGLDPASLLHFGVTTAFSDVMTATLSTASSGSAAVSLWGAVSNPAAAATAAVAGVVSGAVGFCIMLITACVMSTAFLLLSLELLGVTIEAALIGNVGIVMLGFLGSRWTMRYGQNYISYGISVAARIFIIYMLCGVGEVFFYQQEQTSFHAGWTPASLFMICASAYVFVFLVLKINKMTAAIFQGQSSLSGGADIVMPAVQAAVVAGTLGAGAAVAGAAGGAALAGKMAAMKNAVGAGSKMAALPGGPGGGPPGGGPPGAGPVNATPPPGGSGTQSPGNPGGSGNGVAYELVDAGGIRASNNASQLTPPNNKSAADPVSADVKNVTDSSTTSSDSAGDSKKSSVGGRSGASDQKTTATLANGRQSSQSGSEGDVAYQSSLDENDEPAGQYDEPAGQYDEPAGQYDEPAFMESRSAVGEALQNSSKTAATKAAFNQNYQVDPAQTSGDNVLINPATLKATGSENRSAQKRQLGAQQSATGNPGGSRPTGSSGAAQSDPVSQGGGGGFSGNSGDAGDFGDQEVQMPGEYGGSESDAPINSGSASGVPSNTGGHSGGTGSSAMQDRIRQLEQALQKNQRTSRLNKLRRMASNAMTSATSSGGTHHVPFDHHKG